MLLLPLQMTMMMYWEHALRFDGAPFFCFSLPHPCHPSAHADHCQEDMGAGPLCPAIYVLGREIVHRCLLVSQGLPLEVWCDVMYSIAAFEPLACESMSGTAVVLVASRDVDTHWVILRKSRFVCGSRLIITCILCYVRLHSTYRLLFVVSACEPSAVPFHCTI